MWLLVLTNPFHVCCSDEGFRRFCTFLVCHKSLFFLTPDSYQRLVKTGHSNAPYGNTDGGNRQVVLEKYKARAKGKFDSWSFRLFSRTCVLPKAHAHYTEEEADQDTWNRLMGSFDELSGNGKSINWFLSNIIKLKVLP